MIKKNWSKVIKQRNVEDKERAKLYQDPQLPEISSKSISYLNTISDNPIHVNSSPKKQSSSPNSKFLSPSPAKKDGPSSLNTKKRQYPVKDLVANDIKLDSFDPASYLNNFNSKSNYNKNGKSNEHDCKNSNSKKNKLIDDKARKKEIGDWGEEAAYKKLKQLYPDRNTMWHNENYEQGLPYDISQPRNAEQEDHFYEVKSTPASAPDENIVTSFSANQVTKMQEQRKHYTVLRVYRAETAYPKILEIQDPYQKIFHVDRTDQNNKSVTFNPAFLIKSFKLKL